MVEIDFADVVMRIDLELRRRNLKRSALTVLGIGVTSLSHWAKGQIPSSLAIARIADFFGVTIEYLLTGKEAADLGQDEKELLRLFGGLDGRDRTTLLDLARSLASRYGSSLAGAVHPAG